MLKRYFRSVFGIPSRSSHDRYVRNTSTSLLMKSTEPPRRQGFAFAPCAQYSANPRHKEVPLAGLAELLTCTSAQSLSSFGGAQAVGLGDSPTCLLIEQDPPLHCHWRRGG